LTRATADDDGASDVMALTDWVVETGRQAVRTAVSRSLAISNGDSSAKFHGVGAS